MSTTTLNKKFLKSLKLALAPLIVGELGEDPIEVLGLLNVCFFNVLTKFFNSYEMAFQLI